MRRPPGERHTSPAREALSPARCSEPPWWVRPALILATVLAVGFVIRASFACPFTQEDFISFGRAATEGLSISWKDFVISARPFSTRIYFALWGPYLSVAPWQMHLAVFLAHVANVLLWYRIVTRLTADRNLAMASSLLATCHGGFMSIFAMASLIQEAGTAMWALLSILLWLERDRWKWAVVPSFLCYLLATFTKESAFTLPLLLLTWELWRSKPPERLRRVLPLIPLLMTFAGLALWFMVIHPLPADDPYQPVLGRNVFVNLQCLFAWGTAFWQTASKGEGVLPDPLLWPWILPVVIPVILVWRRRWPELVVGGAWTAIFFLPLMPLNNHSYRYHLYLPWFGMTLLVMGAAYAILREHPRRWLGSVVEAIPPVAAMVIAMISADRVATTIGYNLAAGVNAPQGLIRRGFIAESIRQTLTPALKDVRGEAAITFSRPGGTPSYVDRQLASALGYGKAMPCFFPEANWETEFSAYPKEPFPSAFPGRRHFVVTYDNYGNLTGLEEAAR